MFKLSLLLLCFISPVILAIPLVDHGNELNVLGYSHRVLTPSELVEAAGYNSQVHHVTTEDGYILQLDRITGPKGSSASGKKPAVLLLHGLFDSSATWVLSDRTRSLAFLLSDRGYDVWMGNVRGNRYSRNHVALSTTDSKFWNFSWHEMGMYDLPAMIDYILEKTGQKKIFYVGHSQGGTSFFVMASMRPEYQKKLHATFALAPAVFMKRTRSLLIRFLAPIANDLKQLGDLLGIYEFQPSSELTQILGKEACKQGVIFQPICKQIIFLAAGFDRELNMTLIPMIAQYDPAGASTMQLIHYAQLVNSGKFQQYDYGLLGNTIMYKSFQPPEYNLDNVNMPLYIHYSINDALVSYRDSRKLFSTVPHAKKVEVPNKLYAHLDFLWGQNVDRLVYDGIMQEMEKYRNK